MKFFKGAVRLRMPEVQFAYQALGKKISVGVSSVHVTCNSFCVMKHNPAPVDRMKKRCITVKYNHNVPISIKAFHQVLSTVIVFHNLVWKLQLQCRKWLRQKSEPLVSARWKTLVPGALNSQTEGERSVVQDNVKFPLLSCLSEYELKKMSVCVCAGYVGGGFWNRRLNRTTFKRAHILGILEPLNAMLVPSFSCLSGDCWILDEETLHANWSSLSD